MKLSPTNIILSGTIAALTVNPSIVAQDANILLYMNVEWSTDQTNWFLNYQFGQTMSYQVGNNNLYLTSIPSDRYFFRSVVTTNNVHFLDWQVIDTALLVGTNCEQTTNIMFPTVEFLVKPSNSITTPIYYRPFLSITNFTPQNTNTFPQITNNPPTP